MPAFRPIQFAAQSYQGRSVATASERLINLYLEQNPSGAKGPVTLHGTPGLKLFTTVGDGPIRGVINMAGFLWVVSGQELYRVDSLKVSTLIGPVDRAGPVSMTENGTHVAICTSKEAYAAKGQIA